MATMLLKVMLGVAAAVLFCLYAVALAAAAVPMLILTALSFVARRSVPAHVRRMELAPR